MNRAWLLFKSDVKRLAGNVVTIIIVLGLVALPSIFSWYNIIACWNVFDNTGNLTVAVANTDEGYTSDLVPLKINIGDQVTSALRANDQLNWVFTDEEDAVDGARSGRYYAAVVIPTSFSADMMSFFSDDMQHAKITYYSNQKKSAIAPKVTDQGADRVASQVNQVFAETISEIALSISSSLLNYAESTDLNGRMGDLATHANQLSIQVREAANTLSSYSTVLGSAQQLVTNTGNLLSHVQDSADEAAAAAQEARAAAEEAVGSMSAATKSLGDAIANSSGNQADLSGAIDTAFDNAASAATEAEAKLRDAADLAAAAGKQEVAKQLTDTADVIRSANAATQASRAAAKQIASDAQAELTAIQQDFDKNMKPTLDSLMDIVSDVNASLSDTAGRLEDASFDVTGSSASITARIGEAREKIDSAASQLRESADKLQKLSEGITSALQSKDVQTLRTIIGNDPDALAAAVAAPVQLERVAVYPVDNFGSAMSPLYTTLALWIGALLIVVTLRTHPSQRTLEEVGNPTSRQVFVGRFLVVALISFLQSTVLSLGNLLFLGVQTVNPLLYILCFWVAGLVFAFIMYTMVALFANLGKALGVVLLIVQVAGGGGSFPMQLMPGFFQAMSPYLPIAHAVRAMRAAMFGLYNGDFWIELGTLLLFVVPLAILGLALHYPLGKIVPKFIERVERSKLM